MTIQNPHNLTLNQQEEGIIRKVERSGFDLSGFRVTSASRLNDAYGFHRYGLAVDLACDDLKRMIELREYLETTNWPGGVGIAVKPLPLHVHVDRRDLHKDAKHPDGWAPVRFVETSRGVVTEKDANHSAIWRKVLIDHGIA
jgi:hypothetical protein